MSQDTRKDPRAKIVSLNVRYKSATVDEFIENHSHDVSRGGLFIKTSTPFAQGTLLKFEIRLSSDQPVIAGVGRVVWKREPSQAATDRPAGMGVKFIKIDDRSRSLIERLVQTKSDAGVAFASVDEEVTKVHSSLPPRAVPLPSLKPTVSGMPAVAPPSAASDVQTAPVVAVGGASTSAPAPAAAPATGGSSGGGFFPATNSEADMPPPQERTMMRQAAELLEEALKASGGSMEEVGHNPLFSGMATTAGAVSGTAATDLALTPIAPSVTHASPEPAPPPREEPIATIGGFPTTPTGTPALDAPTGASELAPTPMVETPGRRSVPPAPVERPRSNPPPGAGSNPPPRSSASGRPVRATDLLSDSVPKKSSAGIWVTLVVLLAGAGGAYAYMNGALDEYIGRKPAPPPTATPPQTTTVASPPLSAPTLSAAPPTSAPPSVSAAPSGSIAPIASNVPSAAVSATPPAASSAVAVKPVETKPTPPPRPTPPKPVETKPVETKPTDTETKPTETKPVETKPTETKPAETKPAETKPAEGETTPAEPAPKPKPKPKAKPKDDSDNPY